MHNVENPDIGVFEKTNNTILPKTIEIQLDFAPIHEHTIGWNEEGIFYQESFPYGASAEGVSLSDALGQTLEDIGIEESADGTPISTAEFDELMARDDEIKTTMHGKSI
jgi:hypothetical protein